ncbi:MAG: tetrathionate reductase family octaheme c-type cytochrome, partial [bacterium]|nr:tetrathionate reductase family octaheme c-type cytochrome [bacterium]
PDKYRNFYILNSPLFQAPEQKDAANEGKTAPSGRNTNYYEPVRFSHRAHDQAVGGNCGICHHRVSDGDDDRVGEDLKEMHTGIEIRIGGACTTCHEDLKEKEFQKCSACHVASNEKDYPARIGLKGAYHRQCIGCHEEQPPMANAPTDCKSCHHPLTPDHKPLLALTTPPGPLALTSKCLECHPGVGDDVLKSAHWNWKGLTPAISGHEHSIDTGLFKLIDNYTITMSPELVDSNVFHIGYNTGDKRTSFTGVNNLDCLVCHDTTGTYEKDEKRGGLPMEGNDLSAIAESVGRPSRSNCGKCHFNVRAPNAKHGDLEPALANPTPEMDTHMGMVGMRCQDCHTTTNHRIAGLSFLAPVTEDRVGCVKCHGSSPHGITGQLSRHLDDHVKAVACETCHIPLFAHETPTLISTDFSTAGQDRSVEKDSNGMPLYDKKFGSLTWGKQVTPTYRWFDGNRKAYIQGDEIDASEVVELNTPLGEKYIPESRIYPFKVHSANQPYDSETNLLVPVKFKDGFWNHFDWNRAIKDGAAIAGMEYSGKYGFVKTTMYTSIHHEVAPARKALGCADCHSVPAVTCIRCHQSAKGMDQPQHTHMVYPGVKNRFNFKSLGYEDDPAVIGGRFIRKLGRGNPK